MTQIKNIYEVNNLKKLIDLNGDSVNFEIAFRVTSENKEPFDMLVVDQNTLDNNPNIEYKKVTTGEMSGRVVNNDNKFQNYFLILKADKPCKCIVEIARKDIPKNLEKERDVQNNKRDVPVEKPTGNNLNNNLSNNKNEGDEFNWMKTILVVVTVIVVGFCVYWFMQKNEEDCENGVCKMEKSPSSISIPSFKEKNNKPSKLYDSPFLKKSSKSSSLPSLPSIEAKPVAPPSAPAQPPKTNNVLDRLKSLRIG